MKKFLDFFWDWYERHLTFNIAIASVLFSWQIVHLVWLFADVVFSEVFGFSLWPVSVFWQRVIIIVDYTEIPAFVSIALIYVNRLRRGYDFKSVLYIVLLGSQVFHIFWITDTFVVRVFSGDLLTISPILAWIAIMIDYLEVPVMIETFRTLAQRVRKQTA